MLKKFFRVVGIAPKWGNVPVPAENEAAPAESHKPKKTEETNLPRKEKDK